MAGHDLRSSGKPDWYDSWPSTRLQLHARLVAQSVGAYAQAAAEMMTDDHPLAAHECLLLKVPISRQS
jgi:hypothetical protein